MSAEHFLEAFRAGWVAAGKDPGTREYQIACFSAWCDFLKQEGR